MSVGMAAPRYRIARGYSSGSFVLRTLPQLLSSRSRGTDLGQRGRPACRDTTLPRPGCGREYPIRRYRYETLRQIGWPLFRVARYVKCADMGKS